MRLEITLEPATEKDRDQLALVLFRAGYSPYLKDGDAKCLCFVLDEDDTHKVRYEKITERENG